MFKKAEEISSVWQDFDFKKEEGIRPQELDILSLMLKIANSSEKILDIGAGDGRWIKILKDNGVKADFYGVDIINRVKEINAKSIIGDVRLLPFKDNKFDFVYSMGVVEHFPETYQAIKEHSRVTRKEGYVFITVPHLSLVTPKRYFDFFLNREYRKGSFETVRGRNLRIKTLEKMCLSAGLDIIEVRGYGHLYLPILNRNPNLRDKIKNRFSHILGNYMYAHCRKR